MAERPRPLQKKNSYFARWTHKMNPTAQAFSAAAFGTKETESSWFTSLKFSSHYPRISGLWACAGIASEVSSTLPLGVRQDIPSQCCEQLPPPAFEGLSFGRSSHSSQPQNPFLWRSTVFLSPHCTHCRARDTAGGHWRLLLSSLLASLGIPALPFIAP